MIAIAITFGIIRAGRSIGQIANALKPEKLLMMMGNLVSLPQIVFGFVMLDIFIYDINDNHIMPLWLFALIIMIAGGVILAIFFIQAFRHSRSLNL
jgi:ABC-type phosphate transport system permease subunit